VSCSCRDRLARSCCKARPHITRPGVAMCVLCVMSCPLTPAPPPIPAQVIPL
jgi:hypothetical protein